MPFGWLLNYYDYKINGYFGQGEVFNSLMLYYQKIREKIINDLLKIIYIIIKKIMYYKKTCKSLIEPILNKGWKNER